MSKEWVESLARDRASKIVRDLAFVAPEARNEWLMGKLTAALNNFFNKGAEAAFGGGAVCLECASPVPGTRTSSSFCSEACEEVHDRKAYEG